MPFPLPSLYSFPKLNPPVCCQGDCSGGGKIGAMNGLPKESSLALGLEFCISMVFWLLGWILQSQRYLLLNEVPDNMHFFFSICITGFYLSARSLVILVPVILNLPVIQCLQANDRTQFWERGKSSFVLAKTAKVQIQGLMRSCSQGRVSIYSRNLDFLFIDHGGFVVTVTGFGFSRLSDILKAVVDSFSHFSGHGSRTTISFIAFPKKELNREGK